MRNHRHFRRTGTWRLLLVVTVFSSDGDTPLHIAVRGKYGAVVRLLLEKGAPPAAKNPCDVTLLEYGDNAKQIEIVKLLTALDGQNRLPLLSRCPILRA